MSVVYRHKWRREQGEVEEGVGKWKVFAGVRSGEMVDREVHDWEDVTGAGMRIDNNDVAMENTSSVVGVS